ncbi:serine hydrolase [Pontibacter populi]|uniref:Serine hydrolase n=1 Tax=Pontibacter populi TaxID=890055 RepID=A0ABV1RXV8_9BACT
MVLSKTYGTANLGYNIPNTNGTPFQFASDTKLIAATAPITLVQEGKLDLQQKVRKVRASVIEP